MPVGLQAVEEAVASGATASNARRGASGAAAGWCAGWLLRWRGADAAVVKATLAKPLAVTTAKAASGLGLESPVEWQTTLRDCASSLMELGLVPKHRSLSNPGSGSV